MRRKSDLPKPYFKHNDITIYHGDCRDLLQYLPKVDLVLTDPPYGNGTNYESYEDSQEQLVGLIADLMPVVLKQSKRTLVTCGVGNIYLYPNPDWILCWATPAGNGSGPWGFCCWQPILAYGNCPYLKAGLGRKQDILIVTETSQPNGHPCPKPLNLWKKLLMRGSSSQTDTILDPFMGSGTTLVAAKQLGRKAIGIEIEEKYCEIAAKRIDAIQFMAEHEEKKKSGLFF